jgi:hypothetical protein
MALTNLAESGCDPFTLARIGTITITQHYCHPQAEAPELAFANLGGGKRRPQLPDPRTEVGTKMGTAGTGEVGARQQVVYQLGSACGLVSALDFESCQGRLQGDGTIRK